MAKNFRLDITLSDDELKLVEYMTKEHFYGEGSMRDTLKSMFYLQLREDMDLYEEESKK